MDIKIINHSDNPTPKYATKGSAGMDLYADIPYGEITLEPMERQLIQTGISIELPEGYEAQLRPRSGLSLKKGLSLANCVGTIDSDYRGKVGVIMVNLSTYPQTIEHGDRIAQMVISKVEYANIIETVELSVTDRGYGGFGSTGEK